MTNRARKHILTRLRRALTPHHTDDDNHTAGLHVTEPNQKTSTSITLATTAHHEAIHHLSQRLREAHAEVVVAHPSEWVSDLLGLLRRHGFKRLLVGESDVGRHVASAAEGMTVFYYNANIERLSHTLFNEVDVAVTPATAGIVETGSLLLIPDREHPRLMSLVPPAHAVVVWSSQLYAHLADAMAAHRHAITAASHALVISGPSKTADIQQTLAYGAHGPKQLFVVVVDDTEPEHATAYSEVNHA